VNKSNVEKTPPNNAGRIFLTGFMGTGKTHWGRIWAARHHYSFIDLDELIEQEEQQSIADIFEKKGEDYFRQKEAIMLRSLEQYSNVIISCGGGTPCFFDNISWMNTRGISVFLEASPAYILKNILLHEGKRPLIKKLNEAELLFYIEQKLKERTPHYSKALLTLDAENITERTIDSLILSTP
jgi:shikimate kinase